jgi:chorismate dehydratase
MGRVRLGAVGYLNARPHVYGLEQSPRFELRWDVPSRCADLLHGGAIDIGLIPSIEYLRGPAEASADAGYRIVPDIAIASRGPVASVALYTTKPMRDVTSIALDTSSRTSVALARVLCAREFRIQPRLEARGPDLDAMLQDCDAALIIGDTALFLDHLAASRAPEKIDLGELWTARTGLPFVYAFWAGRPGALTADDVRALQAARDQGAANVDAVVREYSDEPARQAIAARYLRDNIKYHLGPEEQAGLGLFYRYAAEAGVVDAGAAAQPLRFY